MPLRRAYTFIELLLVLSILLITTAVAVPLFARSIEGTRLRASAKAIASAHRYARGMAVLKQSGVALMLDPERNLVQVLRMESEAASRPPSSDVFPDAETQDSAWLSSWHEREEAVTNAASRVEVSTLLERELDAQVHIVAIEGVPPEQQWKKRQWVLYRSNGMCDAFTVELEDQRNGRMRVVADGLTGRVDFEE